METLIAFLGLTSMILCPTAIIISIVLAIMKKSASKSLVISGISFLVFFICLIFSAFYCEHEWRPASCTSPQLCLKCEKTSGSALGHIIVEATCSKSKHCSRCETTYGDPLEHTLTEATCTAPQTCSVCNAKIGNPLPHTEGAWRITKSATLTSYGLEEVSCSICNKNYDSREINKKIPKVDGVTFNFTDNELIDWINATTSAKITKGNQLTDSNINTGYKITINGQSGIIFMNHAYGEKVSGIMVYSPEWQSAAALAALIGENIDSDFDSYDAFIAYAYDKAYTSAKMTTTRLNLSGSLEVTLLSTSDAINEVLSQNN